MFRLKLLGRSLCLIQTHGSNSNALYLEFVEESSYALRSIKTNEYTILLRDLNKHVGNDAGVEGCDWPTW